MIYMDEYELSLPEPSVAETVSPGYSSDVKGNYRSRDDEAKPTINAEPVVMYQDVVTTKRMGSEAAKKKRDDDHVKGSPKWTPDRDSESGFESSKLNSLGNPKKPATNGRLRGGTAKHLDELEGAAPRKPAPPPKAECDEDPLDQNYYDLYDEVGIEEEKVLTTKRPNNRTLFRLLMRFTKGLQSNRSRSRRFLSWRSNKQRNKDSTNEKDKNDKCKHLNASSSEKSHEVPQHKEGATKVSVHNEAKFESEWDADAEYEYDEMVDYEQQFTKECPNGVDPNAIDELNDDMVPKDDLQAIHSTVKKPMHQVDDSKDKFFENKPNWQSSLKVMKNLKSLDAGKNCQKQSNEVLDDRVPSKDDGGEIYANTKFFRCLPDAGGNDSPPPIPPKMSQITRTYDDGKKNNKEAHFAGISSRQHSSIFGTFRKRQFSSSRTLLPTRKRNSRSKQVTRMLRLCPVKPKREDKPVPAKEKNGPQVNAQRHVGRLLDGNIGTGVPHAGEGEYEEYCYASELADQAELVQQTHKAKALYDKERPSVAEPEKLEKNNGMLSTVESYVNEDYYEDPETAQPRISMYYQEKPVNRRKVGLKSQIKGGKMLPTPELKRCEVQKLPGRRLPAPPIPASEPAVSNKPKAPTSTDSPVIGATQSSPQITQQRKERVPKEPPRDNPPVSKARSSQSQIPKSETTHSNGSPKANLPSKVKADPDTSSDDPKSTLQPKTIPKIPPRPQHVPQSLFLKLANSTASEAQERPPTPEVTEEQTSREHEQISQEQSDDELVKGEKPCENQPTTVKNQDSTHNDATASTLECENELYMKLEDCY